VGRDARQRGWLRENLHQDLVQVQRFHHADAECTPPPCVPGVRLGCGCAERTPPGVCPAYASDAAAPSVRLPACARCTPRTRPSPRAAAAGAATSPAPGPRSITPRGFSRSLGRSIRGPRGESNWSTRSSSSCQCSFACECPRSRPPPFHGEFVELVSSLRRLRSCRLDLVSPRPRSPPSPGQRASVRASLQLGQPSD